MDKKVSNAIAVIITIVWAASFMADIAIDEYSPSPFVHMIMMGLAGATFGQGFIKSVNGDGPKKEEPPEADPRELTPDELADAARDWLRKSLEEGEK